jgi:pectate lyase
MRLLAMLCGVTTWLLAPWPVPTRAAAQAAGQPAFAGAEGFGTSTPGGRGGREVRVTTLADAGPGSFREAVGASGPRTVVFRVSGLVTLASPITITEPFVTIDGASAPADGVTLRGSDVVVRTHDVVIRHMRFRRIIDSQKDVGGWPADR